MHYAPLYSCSALRKTAWTMRTPVWSVFFILASSIFGAAIASAGLLGDENPVVPGYVLQYAPLVWLHSEDPFRPSDLIQHLEHTVPKVGDKLVEKPSMIDLDNLDQLNRIEEKKVALTSKDDVTKLPAWLYGEKPDADGKLHNATASVVIVVERGLEDVDAFYFYFYSYDQGGNTTQVKEPIRSFFFNDTHKGLNMGNHVGDWEHNMVRFHGGKPTGIYYSQHSDGAAYLWDDNSVTLEDGRPYVYSALGSHANYPASGEQIHDSVLIDYCDKGVLWNPVASAYFFHLDPGSFHLTRLSPSKSDLATSNFTSLFYFDGIWGDDEYAQSDPRQATAPWIGVKRFVAGPQGPAFKGLVRKGLFPDDRGRKTFLQLAVTAFMMVYPHFLRTWRKWVTISVPLVFAAFLVVGRRYRARYYKTTKKGYEQLDVEEVPLMDIPQGRDGSYTPVENHRN